MNTSCYCRCLDNLLHSYCSLFFDKLDTLELKGVQDRLIGDKGVHFFQKTTLSYYSEGKHHTQ